MENNYYGFVIFNNGTNLQNRPISNFYSNLRKSLDPNMGLEGFNFYPKVFFKDFRVRILDIDHKSAVKTKPYIFIKMST